MMSTDSLIPVGVRSWYDPFYYQTDALAGTRGSKFCKFDFSIKYRSFANLTSRVRRYLFVAEK